MVDARTLKVEFSVEARRAIRDLTRAIQKVGNLTAVPEVESSEYHDDETMNKVRVAIEKALEGYSSAEDVCSADDIIRELQNAGILFRERRPN